MSDSIYKIDSHDNNAAYSKNAIVYVQDALAAGETFPKSIEYYYALKNVPQNGGISITDDAYWGGYKAVTTNSKKTIPEFLWTPSYNVSVNHQPKVNSIVFGNGYEQRIPDGIYSTLISINLSFDMRTESESRAIVHFLKTRKGTESFAVKNLPAIYQDGDAYSKRFICSTFNSNFSFADNYNIKATFNETNN